MAVNSDNHPEDLLLRFAEGELSGIDKSDVEKHLRECGQCAEEMRGLTDAINLVRGAKSAFCPESADLFVWARDKKPLGAIYDHVKSCVMCAEEVASYESPAFERIPDELLHKLLRRTGKTADDESPSLWDRISSFFRIPALAVGAALAILLVVVMYPHSPSGPIIGLSAESWEGALKPRAVQRPKAAVVLIFEDSKAAFPQKTIDEIYKALEPDIQISEKYDLITPLEVSETVKGGAVPKSSDLAGVLSDKLGVSDLVTVKIDREGKADITLMNTKSGQIAGRQNPGNISAANAPAVIKENTRKLLLQ